MVIPNPHWGLPSFFQHCVFTVDMVAIAPLHFGCLVLVLMPPIIAFCSLFFDNLQGDRYMDARASCAGLFQSKIVEAVDPSRFRVAYRGAKAWEFIN